MNKPLLTIEAARWNKIGRRWMTVVAVLLTINLSLVALAICGYAARPTTSLVDDSAGDDGDEQVAKAAALQGSDESTGSVAAELADPGNERVAEVATVAPTVIAQPALPPTDDAAIARQPSQNVGTFAAPAATSQSAAGVSDVASTTPIRTPVAGDAQPIDPVIQQPSVVIINPPTSGGEVQYVLDGAVCRLQPGEYQRFAGTQTRRIVFHQGDDLADLDRTVEPGMFVFDVGDAGWQLIQPTSDAIGRLFAACRPIATK